MSLKIYFSMMLVAVSLKASLHASQVVQELEQGTNALQISGQKVVDFALNEKFIDAVRQNDMHKVSKMLSAKKIPDVNARDKAGFTPLMFAVGGGHVNMVKKLIKAGASVNLRALGFDQGTALAFAIYNANNRKIYEPIVRMLINAGANVNVQDSEEATPLMAAIRHPYMVEILLNAGADPLSRNNNEQTARKIAESALKQDKESRIEQDISKIITTIELLKKAEEKKKRDQKLKRMHESAAEQWIEASSKARSHFSAKEEGKKTFFEQPQAIIHSAASSAVAAATTSGSTPADSQRPRGIGEDIAGKISEYF